MIQFLRPEAAALVAASGAAVASAVATGALAWALGSLAPLLGAGGAEPAGPGMLATAATLAGLLAARSLLGRTGSLLAERAADRSVARLRTRVHAHLLRLPIDTVQRLGAAQLGARLGQESLACRSLLGPAWIGLVQQLVALGALLAVAATAWPEAALAGALALPLLAWVGGRTSRRARCQQREAWREHAQVASAGAEAAEHLASWRAAGAEPWLRTRFEERVEEAARRSMAASRAFRLAGGALQLLTAAGLVAAGAWLQHGMGAGQLGPAEAARLLAAAALLVGPTAALAETVHGLAAAAAPFARLLELLELPAEPEGRPPPALRERLRLLGASVRRGEATVLREVTLEARRGELLALAGPNGAGKSTLLMTLGGLLAPHEGELRVDERALGAEERAGWARSVGWVDARPAVLQASILQNVALQASPDEARALRALERVELGGAWLRRRGGLHAPLAPEGGDLSSGERQRLALARALYREARVLLLDEPTAHLDAAGARWTVETLRRLAEAGCLVVACSHDGRLLAAADRVAVLCEGRLTAEAPLAELSPEARALLPLPPEP